MLQKFIIRSKLIKRAGWQFAIRFWGYMLGAIGAILGFWITLRNAVPLGSPVETFLSEKMRSWTFLIVVLAICIGYSIIRSMPRLRCKYYDSRTKTTVIVECCNLLKQEGLKIIHTTTSFDIDKNKIGSRTVNGQFLKEISKHPQALLQLENTLTKLKDTLPDSQQEFARGTLCPFDFKNNYYCLAAFASLDSTAVGKRIKELNTSEYREFFTKLWTGLTDSTYKAERTFNIAVIGKHLSLSSKHTIPQKIDIILDEFYKAANRHICSTLRVCVAVEDAISIVYPEETKSSINQIGSAIDFRSFSTVIRHIAERPHED